MDIPLEQFVITYLQHLGRDFYERPTIFYTLNIDFKISNLLHFQEKYISFENYIMGSNIYQS